MKTYTAIAPDGSQHQRKSSRPLTYGIAHYNEPKSGEINIGWVVSSFSYGTKETAQKRMRSLQKFYGGEWAVLEARENA
jgi:hypothetical protein